MPQNTLEKWRSLYERIETLTAERDTALAKLAKVREALKFTRQQVVYLGAHTTVGVDYITGPIDAVLSEIEEPHNG